VVAVMAFCEIGLGSGRWLGSVEPTSEFGIIPFLNSIGSVAAAVNRYFPPPQKKSRSLIIKQMVRRGSEASEMRCIQCTTSTRLPFRASPGRVHELPDLVVVVDVHEEPLAPGPLMRGGG